MKKKPLLVRLGVTRGKIWAWVIAPALIATFASTTVSYATGAQIYRVDTVFVPKTIEVMKELPIPPIMQAIAECESQDKQFNKDGSVVTGRKVPSDRGRWQINAGYWREKALELGYDIETEEGNKDMAMWLFLNRGTRDWSASSKCWVRKTS